MGILERPPKSKILKSRRGKASALVDAQVFVFWPAFGCCAHPKAGKNEFFHPFSNFQTFLLISGVKSLKKSLKKVENGWKKYFDQLSGACSTQKRVKIHNTQGMAIGFAHQILFIKVIGIRRRVLGQLPRDVIADWSEERDQLLQRLDRLHPQLELATDKLQGLHGTVLKFKQVKVKIEVAQFSIQ